MKDLPESANAELAYLFRHAMLRDAAYNLQLPGDRARMHWLAHSLIEAAFGGPLPPAAPFSKESSAPHQLDAIASELARHARFALDGGLDALQPLRCALRRAADYAERQYRHAEALEHWLQLLDFCEPVDRGWVLVRLARQMFFVQRVAEAEARLREAIALASHQGDVALKARAMSTLGSVLRQTERGHETGKLYQQALELQRTLGNSGVLAGDLGNAGIFYESEGQMELAEATFQEALALSRQYGDLAQQARLLGYLGDFCRDTGRMDEAFRYLTEARQLAKDAGSLAEFALDEERLGVWHAIRGELDQAEVALTSAVGLFRAMGNLRSLGMTLGNLGNLLYDRGQLAEAEQTLQRALSIHEEVGNVAFKPNTLSNLGAVRLRLGDIPGACALYARAVELMPFSRSPVVRGAILLGYATCLAAAGDRAKALAHWHDGSTTLRKCGADRELEARLAEMRMQCAKAAVDPLA